MKTLAEMCEPAPDNFDMTSPFGVPPPDGIKYPNPHDFETGRDYWEAVYEFNRLSDEHEAKTGKHFQVWGWEFWRGLPIWPWDDPSEIRIPDPCAWAIREKFSMFVRPKSKFPGTMDRTKPLTVSTEDLTK